MNRKEGGTGGGKEGSPQLEPGRKLPGTGAGGGRQDWRQGGTGAGRSQARLEARRNAGKEEAIFGVFFGKKRKKEG